MALVQGVAQCAGWWLVTLLRSNATHTPATAQQQSAVLSNQNTEHKHSLSSCLANTPPHTWLVRGGCEKVATEQQQQQEDAPAPAALLPVPGHQQGGLQPPAHQLQESRQRARDGAGDGQVGCYLEQEGYTRFRTYYDFTRHIL